MHSRYKTSPIRSLGFSTSLIKVTNASLKVKTAAKVAQIQKETRRKDKKNQNALGKAALGSPFLCSGPILPGLETELG